MPAARVDVPGVDFSPLVAATHVMSPVAGDENTVAEWSQGMAAAKAQLDNFATDAGPGAVIIGGDYNSTPDLRQFRELLTHGYRDAVDQTGSGFAPTYPSNTWFPPIITADSAALGGAEKVSPHAVGAEDRRTAGIDRGRGVHDGDAVILQQRARRSTGRVEGQGGSQLV